MNTRNDHVRHVTHMMDGTEVSSVRGYVYGIKVDETCIFPPSELDPDGTKSEVVGTYDDHDKVVATLRFAWRTTCDKTSVTPCDGDMKGNQ